MADNPDIEVQYEIIPNNDFATKMLASMGTGTGPDIINMDDNQMRSIYIPKGSVQEVDPVGMGYASLDDLKAAYIPGALEGVDRRRQDLRRAERVQRHRLRSSTPALSRRSGSIRPRRPSPGTRSATRARSWSSWMATP